MTADTLTIADVAAEARAFFQVKQRDDGATYIITAGDAPDWVNELVREAHGDMLPDDWRYQTIRAALDFIAENPDDAEDGADEFADGAVDTYTGARLAWLASHLNRPGYVDDAEAEFGYPGREAGGVVQMIGLGQYGEAFEVYGSVYQSVAERWMEAS